jgi:hypothetical protein
MEKIPSVTLLLALIFPFFPFSTPPQQTSGTSCCIAHHLKMNQHTSQTQTHRKLFFLLCIVEMMMGTSREL